MINREISRIRTIVREAEKQGYIFGNVIPKNPNVTKSTLSRLRSISREDLLKTARRVDVETGEIIDTQAERNRERKIQEREQKKLKRKRRENLKQKKRERRASELTNVEPFYDTYLPDGGEIIYSNVVEEFIMRLSEPTQEYTTTRSGKLSKRWDKLVEASESAKHTLLSITNSVIELEGKSALGWRLETQADEVQILLMYVLYGSDATRIASACSELASIVKGSPLTMQELMDIAEQEEYNEDWEYPT